ncbi:MAG TPA: hypothetical protein VJ964_01540 [Balneolaceae bacterium]|nr:hypothetical protein [Balneolaceae bacterium]
MLKKLSILLGLLIILNAPLAAQSAHIQLTYQSFRPFIHFQLDVNNFRRNYNSYESTYLQGYMDGVNDQYYYRHRFINMNRNIHAYRSGYRDGFRDRALLIRLRGQRWYVRHRFDYDDYYAPTYAVRIWLDNLSLAFLKAPERRLPREWRRRAHPHLKRYRQWMSHRSHRKDYDDYYSTSNIERRFKSRIRGYRQKMNKTRRQNRRRTSYNHKRVQEKRVGTRGRFKSSYHKRTNRSQKHRTRVVNKRRSRNRNVNKGHSRGRIHKNRKPHSHKPKRQRNRSRKRGRGHKH